MYLGKILCVFLGFSNIFTNKKINFDNNKLKFDTEITFIYYNKNLNFHIDILIIFGL